MRVEPYFLKDKKWYRIKPEGLGYTLTEAGKRDPKVVASYEEFYSDNDGELN